MEDVGRSWTRICHLATQHAFHLGAKCSEDAAALIDNDTTAFCAQTSPTNAVELTRRHSQAMRLTCKLGCIAACDSAARHFPAHARAIRERLAMFLWATGGDASPYEEANDLRCWLSGVVGKRLGYDFEGDFPSVRDWAAAATNEGIPVFGS